MTSASATEIYHDMTLDLRGSLSQF